MSYFRFGRCVALTAENGIQSDRYQKTIRPLIDLSTAQPSQGIDLLPIDRILPFHQILW